MASEQKENQRKEEKRMKKNMKKNMKKIMALLLTVTLSLGLYGCGSKNDKTESGTSTAAESDTSAAATDGSEKKTLVIGDDDFQSFQ